MQRIRKGDDVVIIAGKERGRRGTVLRVLRNGKIVVEGLNLVKRHTKPQPQLGQQGGIVEKEMPLDASNVQLFNPVTNRPDRVGFKMLRDGDGERKVRYFKSNDEVVDIIK